MRFMVDECTGPAVARWLRQEQHEVFSVFDEARGMGDDEIIKKAFSENWVLVTNDKDFGEQVYRRRQPHCGVILMRLEKILPLTKDFDCLVGYFFISGFFRLYPSLESVSKVRILIGLKNEQVVYGLIRIAEEGGGEGAPSIAETKITLMGMMRKELIEADDSLAIEVGVRKFIEWIRSGKLEVKLYREQNIHAKVYIMTPASPVPDVNHGYVITGSSNFSHSGLEGNLEFNVLLAEPEEHDYALHRFNELWKDAIDVKEVHEAIFQAVEKESPFAFFTPHELYLKFLVEYFRDYLGERSKLTAENLPANFKKLQ